MSWNILHGGGSRVRQILEVIERQQPDILLLQEVRHGKSKVPLFGGLADLGLSAAYAPEPPQAKQNSVAIFSADALETTPLYEEKGGVRILSAQSPFGLTVTNVSFPHKRAQLPLFDVLDDLPFDGKQVIMGDFNCGIPFEDSETKSFDNTHRFQHLLKKGWVDCWRSRNPEAREFTWISTQKKNGFRYDHALASPGLDGVVQAVSYDHEARESGASDHSGLVVDVGV